MYKYAYRKSNHGYYCVYDAKSKVLKIYAQNRGKIYYYGSNERWKQSLKQPFYDISSWQPSNT